MGDKSKYEGKSKDELTSEANKRGVTVAPNADEDQIRQALEQADKQEQGQGAGSNR
jgi:hypothetical protein